jgi:uncharacterized membrane protein (DUF106 family)
MELLKAMQEMMDAYQAKILAAMDANHKEMVACLGKTEARDLEANPETWNPKQSIGRSPRKKPW